MRIIIKSRSRDLSPDGPKQYGSIYGQAKLFVQKDMDFHTNMPQISSPDVAWPEQFAGYLIGMET